MKLKFFSSDDFYTFNPELTKAERLLAEEYTHSDFDFGDFEVTFGYFAGAIILKYYSDDVGYHFEAPQALSENVDFEAAYKAITEYTLIEGIPEIVVGVPEDHREFMLRGALDYGEYCDDDGSYTVEIYTECRSAEELPEIMVDDVYLGEFAIKYAAPYEKLIKNSELNKYFGYNVLDDIPCGNGVDFIEAGRRDFEFGESMTFAATVYDGEENTFVGEGCLFAFDGRGAVKASFRVLPEYHRHGIGSKILRGLIGIASELGLSKLVCEIDANNEPSNRLVERYGKLVNSENERNIFEILL